MAHDPTAEIAALRASRDGAYALTPELMCVEMVIRNECERGCTQRSVALTYALGLRSSWPTDWASANQAIVARWGLKGLIRVKTLAWRFYEGKEVPR